MYTYISAEASFNPLNSIRKRSNSFFSSLTICDGLIAFHTVLCFLVDGSQMWNHFVILALFLFVCVCVCVLCVVCDNMFSFSSPLPPSTVRVPCKSMNAEKSIGINDRTSELKRVSGSQRH